MLSKKNKHIGFHISKDGKIVPINSDAHIRQSIRSIMLTSKKERVIYTELGGELNNYQFRIIYPGIFRKMEAHIETILEKSEPRIIISEVKVFRNEVHPKGIVAQLRYKIKESGRVCTLKLGLNI